MAYIVIIHSKPDSPSRLDEIISRHTEIPVNMIQDGEIIEQNHIYIVPPGHNIAFYNGTIQYANGGLGPRLSIDATFKSLAEDRKDLSAGIILSGTGTDGTRGIKEIKQAEGLVLIQSPESAEYSGMPRSALETGVIDKAAAPGEMPGLLKKHFDDSRLHPAPKEDRKLLSDPDFNKVFAVLRQVTGHDFSGYKRSTRTRRIIRRMNLNQIDRIDNYIRFLRDNKQEARTLFKEFLIGVTSFFRDSESFDSLKDTIQNHFKEVSSPETFRVWIPACSTGEEAYSVAMTIREVMDELSETVSLQVFATDIDEEAVKKAREGVFRESIEQDVSRERLDSFFVKENSLSD